MIQACKMDELAILGLQRLDHGQCNCRCDRQMMNEPMETCSTRTPCTGLRVVICLRMRWKFPEIILEHVDISCEISAEIVRSD